MTVAWKRVMPIVNTVLALITVLSIVGLAVHGVSLKIYLKATDEALTKSAIGSRLWGIAAVTAVVMIVAYRMRRHLPAAVVTGLLVLGAASGPAAELWAAKRLGPPGPEMAAVNAFVPPAGTTLEGTKVRIGKKNPQVLRRWRVGAPVAETCGELRSAFGLWASPGSVTVDEIGACYMRGARGSASAGAYVYVSPPFGSQQGVAFLILQLDGRVTQPER